MGRNRGRGGRDPANRADGESVLDAIRQKASTGYGFAPYDAPQEKDALVNEVKSNQRADNNWRDAWENYCDSVGGGVRDPARHTVAFIQQALSVLGPADKSKAPLGRRAGGGGGGGGGGAVGGAGALDLAALQQTAGLASLLPSLGINVDLQSLQALTSLLNPQQQQQQALNPLASLLQPAAQPQPQSSLANFLAALSGQQPTFQQPQQLGGQLSLGGLGGVGGGTMGGNDPIAAWARSVGVEGQLIERVRNLDPHSQMALMSKVKPEGKRSMHHLVRELCQMAEQGQDIATQDPYVKNPRELKQCRKGHPLRVISGAPACYGDQPVFCDSCRERDLQVKLEGFWHCDLCDYDACNSCVLQRTVGEVPVPARHVGLLVGTGGSTLKKLQKKVPGVVFRIPRKNVDPPNTPILVIGKQAEIDEAIEAMKEVIANHQHEKEREQEKLTEAQKEFKLGEEVVATGLVNQTELNGKVGRVAGYGYEGQNKGRILVQFADRGENLLKPQNLRHHVNAQDLM